MNKHTFFFRIILPVIVLQSIHYQLFNEKALLTFFEISDDLFIQLYTLFIAVRAINALLIIANHKLKRSYLQFALLSSIELILLIIAYSSIEHWSLISDLGHLSSIITTNFYLSLIFQLALIIFAIKAWKKEREDIHMNFMIKISFYFIIPLIFFFTLNRNNRFYSTNQCIKILSKNETTNYTNFIEKSGLIGSDVTILKSLSAHTFLPSKKYIVYLMDSQCESCWRGISNVKGFKDIPEIEDVILFDVADPKNRTKTFTAFGLTEFTSYNLEWDTQYYLSVPTMITIEDKKIKNIYTKSIPCTYEIDAIF